MASCHSEATKRTHLCRKIDEPHAWVCSISVCPRPWGGEEGMGGWVPPPASPPLLWGCGAEAGWFPGA